MFGKFRTIFTPNVDRNIHVSDESLKNGPQDTLLDEFNVEK